MSADCHCQVPLTWRWRRRWGYWRRGPWHLWHGGRRIRTYHRAWTWTCEYCSRDHCTEDEFARWYRVCVLFVVRCGCPLWLVFVRCGCVYAVFPDMALRRPARLVHVYVPRRSPVRLRSSRPPTTSTWATSTSMARYAGMKAPSTIYNGMVPYAFVYSIWYVAYVWKISICFLN